MTKQEIKAFPFKDYDDSVCEGMDLRDYIATAALQGLLSGGIRMHESNYCNPFQDAAYFSYKYADEMLQARERK